MGSVWTIVVAAGSGSRFGQGSPPHPLPKQYQPLGDRRVVDWSLRAARTVSDGIVLVVPDEHRSDHEPEADVVVAGDISRSGSVRAGLAAVPEDAEVIVVHDGARPLAPKDLFATVIDAVQRGAVGVIPAVPVIDTVRSRGGGVVDRRDLVVVQTPQAFQAEALRAAHSDGHREATDDAALVEASGNPVQLVAGAPTNIKITYPTDLLTAEALLPGVR